MSSTKVTLTKETWTQVTTTDKAGSILHLSGGAVVYLEAPTTPTTFDSDTPRMKTTNKEDVWPYSKIAETDFLFAYAINEDAAISVTPIYPVEV